MIADDSDSTRTILKDILSRSEYSVVAEARDGLETIKKMKSMKPDILLLDYYMPEKDGAYVLRKIKKSMDATKVIMITASDEQELIESCAQMGASAYIVKPFDAYMVFKAISYSIGNNVPNVKL
jgi:two-component system, chemotaxis family, chemotaxis protein CheY